MSKRTMLAIIIALLVVIASGVGYMVNEKRIEKKQEQERIEAQKKLQEADDALADQMLLESAKITETPENYEKLKKQILEKHKHKK